MAHGTPVEKDAQAFLRRVWMAGRVIPLARRRKKATRTG